MNINAEVSRTLHLYEHLYCIVHLDEFHNSSYFFIFTLETPNVLAVASCEVLFTKNVFISQETFCQYSQICNDTTQLSNINIKE